MIWWAIMIVSLVKTPQQVKLGDNTKGMLTDIDEQTSEISVFTSSVQICINDRKWFEEEVC